MREASFNCSCEGVRSAPPCQRGWGVENSHLEALRRRKLRIRHAEGFPPGPVQPVSKGEGEEDANQANAPKRTTRLSGPLDKQMSHET